MALWGVTDADESLPTWTLGNQKLRNDIYATQAGWVHRHADGYEEVLECVRGLAVDLDNPNIIGFEFVTDEISAATNVITVDIAWNEAVSVTAGSPTVVVTRTGSASDSHTLVYTATGSTDNSKRFTLGSTALVTGDILTLGTGNVALAGGEIKDTVTLTNVASSTASMLDLTGITDITHTVTAT